jgi:thioredoxin reductase
MKNFDVIIIGGSYAGLAAGMALGRSMRNVLIVDKGDPCNRQTPHSHNFLTQDGEKPAHLRAIAMQQVLAYPTVQLLHDEVSQVSRGARGFEVVTDSETFLASKLLFATGLTDIQPNMEGFAETWGITTIHCPYCHGYELRNTPTGVLANGEIAFEFARFIHHWSKELTLFTNGPALLTELQRKILMELNISVIEREIKSIHHTDGHIHAAILTDGRSVNLSALYAKIPTSQKCDIPEQLGCNLDESGFIVVDPFQKTNIPDVYAAGDCTTMLRSVASAVAGGTKAGAFINHDLIRERYDAGIA